MRRTLMTLLASAAVLSGCNTVRGVGADIESVANAFEPGRTYAVCGSYGVLDRNGFIGCAEGDRDLSTTYKARLTESLRRKHGHR